ncbi:MAG: hypothetical protein JKX97_03010 [Candidatus Lindowbacteria bacterium]|nr:hypothetical protein [Candidatus Lindowbacteria bacterium]
MNDKQENRDVITLSTPDTVLDAFGKFLSALRSYDTAIKAGDIPDDAVQREMEEAFDQLTALSSHLSRLHSRIRDSIMSQEIERKRMAREIHDGPAQSVAAMVRKVEFCQRLLQKERFGELGESLEETKLELQNGVVQIRRIISNLRPPELDHLGLSQSIERFARKVGVENDIKIEVHIERNFLLNSDDEAVVFRIIQEAMNNIVKHAGAGHVSVTTQRREILPDVSDLIIMIEDDGIGLKENFNQDDLVDGRKFGLISMRERAEILGGVLEFGRSDLGGLLVRLSLRQTTVSNQ